MKIRAYIGVIGAGKDYRCSKECTHKVSFADELRKDVWKILGWEPKTDEEKHNCLCKHCERAILYDAETLMNVYHGYLDKED